MGHERERAPGGLALEEEGLESKKIFGIEYNPDKSACLEIYHQIDLAAIYKTRRFFQCCGSTLVSIRIRVQHF